MSSLPRLADLDIPGECPFALRPTGSYAVGPFSPLDSSPGASHLLGRPASRNPFGRRRLPLASPVPLTSGPPSSGMPCPHSQPLSSNATLQNPPFVNLDDMDMEVALLTAECEMEAPLHSRNAENRRRVSPILPASSFSRARIGAARRRPLPPRVPHRSSLYSAPGISGAARSSPPKPRWTPVVWNGPRSTSSLPRARPSTAHRAAESSSSRGNLHGGAPVPSFANRDTLRRRERRQALLARVRASLHGRRGNRARHDGPRTLRPPRVPRTSTYQSQWEGFLSRVLSTIVPPGRRFRGPRGPRRRPDASSNKPLPEPVGAASQESGAPIVPAASCIPPQTSGGVAEQQFAFDDSQMRPFGPCPELLRLTSDELGYLARGEIGALLRNQASWPFCLRSRPDAPWLQVLRTWRLVWVRRLSLLDSDASLTSSMMDCHQQRIIIMLAYLVEQERLWANSVQGLGSQS